MVKIVNPLKKPDENFSKRLHKLFFKNVRDGFFIECGSADGIDHNICVWFEDNMGWTGLNIEPNPHAYKHLATNRPNCINENLALSDSEGEATIHIPTGGPRKNEPLQASLESWRKDFWAGKMPGGYKGALKGTKVEEVTVKTDTYTNVIARNGVDKVDLFILDVEGHEVPALRGMIESPVLPRVIVVENNKTDMDEVYRMIDPLGYAVNGGCGANNFFVRKA